MQRHKQTDTYRDRQTDTHRQSVSFQQGFALHDYVKFPDFSVRLKLTPAHKSQTFPADVIYGQPLDIT